MPFDFDNSYARLPEAFYARIKPTPVMSPAIIQLNQRLASQLGLDLERFNTPEALAILSGNQLAQGS